MYFEIRLLMLPELSTIDPPGIPSLVPSMIPKYQVSGMHFIVLCALQVETDSFGSQEIACESLFKYINSRLHQSHAPPVCD